MAAEAVFNLLVLPAFLYPRFLAVYPSPYLLDFLPP